MKNLSDTHLGVFYALGAYLMWGFAPVYFKYLQFIPVYEILAHRVVWSLLVTALIISYSNGWGNVLQLLQSPKKIALLALTSLLISGNWMMFIWAINNGYMLDASLGYFINPIINVLFGLFFLQESLSRIKWLAVMLAVIGVSIQVVQLGEIPWIALFLANSFAIYGLVRKKIKIAALTGLFVETLLVTPIALYYLVYIANGPSANMFENSWSLNIWLMFAGVVTAMPLIFFGQAALRLKLSTLGFFQYLAPTLMFLFAVFIYAEPLSLVKMVTFVFIWLGVCLFACENKIQTWLK
ncbi:EamA family transporter RarD [Psychromonas sp. MME2]|uniref:EamA family transporter RarD n=1 Tax=unclassified Psychromonas TaxID=2614957 RepID=UPI00339BD7F5